MDGKIAVGHPVDVASGTVFSEELDFRSGGVLPIEFHRYYSTALIGSAGALGSGWRHSFELELRENLTGIVFRDYTGSETAFVDAHDQLARTGRAINIGEGAELRGTLAQLDVRKYNGPFPRNNYRFERQADGSYRLAAVFIDPRNYLQMVYDRNGRLAAIDHPRCKLRLTLHYDVADRVEQISYEGEIREGLLRYEYEQGRLARVRDGRGVLTAYEYDRRGAMVTEQRRGGRLFSFRYDGKGRCIYASGTNRFEERHLSYGIGTTEVRDSHGHVTTYHWNDAGQVTMVETALKTVAVFQYDDEGRRIKAINPTGAISAVEYDALGRPCANVYPGGLRTEIDYDDQHLPVRARGVDGKEWSYDYDARGLMVRSTNPLGAQCHYTHNDFGELESMIDQAGSRWTLHRDHRGFFRGMTEPSGGTWAYELDGWGRAVVRRDPQGAEMRIEYDVDGNIVAFTEPEGRRWQLDYDDAGNVTRQVEPDGSETRHTYNTCGQVLETRLPDGSTQHFEWDTEPGRVLRIVDGSGNSVEYDYDALGRPVSRRNWDGTRTVFEYDAVGNVTAVTGPDGRRHELAYDPWGQLIERRRPDGEVATYEYDGNGMLTRAEEDGHVVEYERDLYGRVLAEIQDGHRIEYEYDAAGKRTTMRTPLGPELRYAWTPAGGLRELAFGGDVIGFEYNLLGLETARLLPGGGSFRHRYDKNGRIVDQWFSPPGSHGGTAGALRVGDPPAPLVRRYEYDGNAHLWKIIDSVRGNRHFVHGPTGRLNAMYGPRSAEFYDYDDAGNRTTSAIMRAGRPPATDQAFPVNAQGRRRLDVDQLRQLGAELEDFSRADGNRIVRKRSARRIVDYRLDDAGFVVEKRVRDEGTGRDESWLFEWNERGLLAAVIRPDKERYSYSYDPLGRRVEKTDAQGRVARYIWDERRLLHVVDVDEKVTTLLCHPSNDQPLARLRGDVAEFVLPDHLQAASELVDRSGALTWVRGDGTWGAPGQQELEFGYPGQYWDPESGLYYNQFRYYDVDLGRYLSPDPIGLLGGLNEYNYAPSPIEWTDLYGLAKTFGGGPFPYTGGHDANGYPALRYGEDRYVRDGSRTRTVPNAGGGSSPVDGGGKSISVLRTPQGSELGFISGQGRRGSSARRSGIPASWLVGTHQMGNYTHGEIQALNWLRLNGTPGQQYHLFIDRPPCRDCTGSLPEALRYMRERGFQVEVWYIRTDPDTGERFWHRHPDSC